MKKLILFFLFCTTLSTAQNYVDLLRIGYGESFNNSFEGTNSETSITSFDASITIPLPLTEKYTFITGADFSLNNLQLFPEASFTSLYSTTLKVGLATTHSDVWSSTLVLLPKIASDYSGVSSEDFFLGGFAVFKFKKKENLIYRFGAYGSTEAFGFFATPIIGWYYLSPNERFEMDVSMPISADVNYALGGVTVGVDYFGIGRSFNIDSNLPKTYVQQGALEFSGYVQGNVLQKSVLLRAKIGYASSDFEVYEDGDTYDLGLSAFRFGDDRTRLNPELSGGAFLKFEAIYRFNIKKKESILDSQ